jgi:hypothetical protein
VTFSTPRSALAYESWSGVTDAEPREQVLPFHDFSCYIVTRRANNGQSEGEDEMASMVGGDLEQLQVLEQHLRADAATVGDLRSRIASVLASTVWTGPAAEHFREEWLGSFGPALGQLAEALTNSAAVVANRRQAIFAATA